MTFLKPFQGEGQNFRIFPTRKARILTKEKQLVQVSLWQVIERRKFLPLRTEPLKKGGRKFPRGRTAWRKMVGEIGIHKLFTTNESPATYGSFEDRNRAHGGSRKKRRFSHAFPTCWVWRKRGKSRRFKGRLPRAWRLRSRGEKHSQEKSRHAADKNIIRPSNGGPP